MNHNNFLVILGHFYPMGIFSKKSSSVTHNYIWAPNIMLSFRKKLMNQSRENVQTGRRMDGQALFYRTLPAELKTYKMKFINQKTNKQKGLNFKLTEAGGQKILSSKYLKDRICKIKQYLNYILMIINQNILAILRTSLNLQKKL